MAWRGIVFVMACSSLEPFKSTYRRAYRVSSFQARALGGLEAYSLSGTWYMTSQQTTLHHWASLAYDPNCLQFAQVPGHQKYSTNSPKPLRIAQKTNILHAFGEVELRFKFRRRAVLIDQTLSPKL